MLNGEDGFNVNGPHDSLLADFFALSVEQVSGSIKLDTVFVKGKDPKVLAIHMTQTFPKPRQLELLKEDLARVHDLRF